MGVSRNPLELAAKLGRLQADLVDGTRRGVRAGGLLVKASVEQEKNRLVPSGLRSGARAGRSTGKALSVRYDDLRGDPQNPAGIVAARGPWQVVERPTRPHEIRPKALQREIGAGLGALLTGVGTTRRRGSKRSRVLKIGGDYATHARHPGSQRPPQPFHKGANRAVPGVAPLVAKEHQRVMGRIFG